MREEIFKGLCPQEIANIKIREKISNLFEKNRYFAIQQ